MSQAKLRWVSILLISCMAVSCSVPAADSYCAAQVWEELNGNGIQDSDEKPMAGVVIELVSHSDGKLWLRLVSDSEGKVSARCPDGCGQYDIYVSVPDDYWPTTPVVDFGACGAQFGLSLK